MSNVYFGIDLGTSNSSISYVVDSPRSVQSVFLEPTTVRFQAPSNAVMFQNWHRMPSMIYVDKGRVLAGIRAAEESIGKKAKPFENLFLSAKSDIGTLKVYEDSVRPELTTPVDVTAETLKELVKAAERESGVSPRKCKVVITVPASFMHAQRRATIEAARMAGLTIEDGDLLDEPIAAFIHTVSHQKLDAQLSMGTPRNLVMFDLGAGTCDVSVFEASYEGTLFVSGVGLSITNLSIGNYQKLGGDNIDLRIVEEELLPLFCEKNGLDFGELNEWDKRRLRFRLKLHAKLVKEAICAKIGHSASRTAIKQPWKLEPFVAHLSSEGIFKTRTVLGKLSYDRFIDLISPFLDDNSSHASNLCDDYQVASFFGPVFDCLDKAGLDYDDVDAFIFNGGSCRNLVIQERFRELPALRKAKFFETPDLDLSVSKGAAIHCYHLHKSGRAIVNPIVNDEIGIMTYGNRKERLVEAGTVLPVPANGGALVNDSFVLPKECMREVGIPIYCGNGRIVSSLKLSLPEGTGKGDPVTVGLKIDSNKVMSFSAYLKDNPQHKIDIELKSPWTHNLCTPEDRAADELWQQTYDLKKRGGQVSTETMMELANRERLRGNVDGALEILQRLQEKGVDTSFQNNILGLCYDRLGREEKARAHFKKAAELNPNDVVHVTNYGAAMVESGDIQGALSQLRLAVMVNEDHYFPYYWLGYVYRRLGDESQAVKEYKKARQILMRLVARHPDSDHYLEYLASVHRSLGDYEEAESVRRQREMVRVRKILDVSAEDIVAGPESGLWKESEFHEQGTP